MCLPRSFCLRGLASCVLYLSLCLLMNASFVSSRPPTPASILCEKAPTTHPPCLHTPPPTPRLTR
ncbi:hypothetical protein DPEC_G00005680 [Dallia pectoralis]|uniref:Uncharacterized protein n=1 Tax=Dallia pectoralis TaxID=75939 RepID=A0ACC2HK04_DALPE|nr:hypothetical protein DPEC_G00005680 [Dallia pectoralis]